MFSKRIPLFKLFGFRVSIDVTWFILVILVTWTLAEEVFPHHFAKYGDFSKLTYLWMGIAGAFGLFVSIIFHEFCHSLVASRYGLPMKGITLFIFGGVAEMVDEPDRPRTEFLMAVAGPISSVLLGTGLFLISLAVKQIGWLGTVMAVLQWLITLNLALAVFNLLPAFPLDGGRVLRSILWAVKGNLRWATKIASQLGSAFGFFLIVMGLWFFIGGDFIGGVWLALIGMFIRNASKMSYRQMLLRGSLASEEIRNFMKTDLITVSPSISIEQLVNDYFYRHHLKMFPVCDGDILLGCITPEQVKQVPRDQWPQQTVVQLIKLCTPENTISPQTDAVKALSIMSRTGNSRLLVVDEGRLVGIVTLKDMLKFLDLKIDLEGQ